MTRQPQTTSLGYPYRQGHLIVGTSPPMQGVYQRIARVAPVDETVLLSGETGTGKELVAQAIHYQSPRAKGPFLPINCAALPEALIEAELFGHRRGAFSGAITDRPGAFEAADGGTIFLDEIGEMPPTLQPCLLRVLQEQAVKRIGDNHERPVYVRVIAATSRDLETAVHCDGFRASLYYRLNVLPIHLPPLRERTGDLPLLVDYFTDRFGRQYGRKRRWTAAAMAELQRHDWPGNVRELKAAVQRAILYADGAAISGADLEGEVAFGARRLPGVDGHPPPFSVSSEAEVQPYTAARRAFGVWYVQQVLRLTGGNQTRAAQRLGLNRNSIRRILERGAV